MLRGLLAAGIGFVAGYIIGAVFGFRTAVVDYVENDADQIEDVADDIYPNEEDGLPPEVAEAVEELQDSGEGSSADTSDEDRAFQ